MSQPISFRWPMLALVSFCGLALGCGADTTTLTSIGGDDETPLVEEPRLTPQPPERAAPPPAGAAVEPPAAEPVPAPAPKNPEPVQPSPDDPPSREPPPNGVFGNWCSRTGLEPDDAYFAAIEASDEYVQAVLGDCEVSALTFGMTGDELFDWGSYLIEYIYLFTGCPLLEEPLENGLSDFGPAHLDFAGLPSPRLGRDDAQRLSAHFTDALVTAFALTASDRAAVELVLARSAEQQIDPGSSSVLSQCNSGAGDAGAGDAGL